MRASRNETENSLYSGGSFSLGIKSDVQVHKNIKTLQSFDLISSCTSVEEKYKKKISKMKFLVSVTKKDK